MAFSTGDSLNGFNAEAVPAEALAVPNARNERLANPGERSSGGGPARSWILQLIKTDKFFR